MSDICQAKQLSRNNISRVMCVKKRATHWRRHLIHFAVISSYARFARLRARRMASLVPTNYIYMCVMIMRLKWISICVDSSIVTRRAGSGKIMKVFLGNGNNRERIRIKCATLHLVRKIFPMRCQQKVLKSNKNINIFAYILFGMLYNIKYLNKNHKCMVGH